MLLQQMNIGHRHATVHSFAHVINREQGYLHGGEGFHFHTRLAYRLHSGRALNAVRGFIYRKLKTKAEPNFR